MTTADSVTYCQLPDLLVQLHQQTGHSVKLIINFRGLTVASSDMLINSTCGEE